MRINLGVLAMTAVLCGLVGCQGQKKSDENSPLVKVGRHTLTKRDYNSFSSAQRIFPLKAPQVWPGFRSTVTCMLETDVLYARAPGSLKARVGRHTDDWKWKQRYFEAQLYVMGVLVRNLGFSDREVEEYYNAQREDSFKVVTKVPPKPDTTRADTTKTVSDSSTWKDTTYYRPLAEVRERIIQRMFVKTYPPDSSYVRRYFGDTVKDSSALLTQWYQYMSRYIRNRDQDYFLGRFYAQYYGKPLPDSIDLWMGEGKLVTPADLQIVMGWLPQSERGRFETPRGQKELGRWVLRWRVYARRAAETGFSRQKDVRATLDWVWKLHVASEYVVQVLMPQMRAGVAVDTALCAYSLWDERDRVTIPPDSAALATEVQTKGDRMLATRLDSLVYGLRVKRGVKFLQNDYRDSKDESPVKLLARADSLRDTGNAASAETEYRKLVTDFAWTPQADTALGELAKIVTEKQSYKDAIRNYRLYLFETRDSSRMCNTFFMIGFIYDEYLNQPQLAEVNYKWILKNMPGCELADDAEFMMLHLDEPMISIEELRGQALRQGRKVDFSDTLDVDTTVADTAGVAARS